MVSSKTMAVITPKCLKFITPKIGSFIYVLNTIENDLPHAIDGACGHWLVITVESRHSQTDKMGGRSKDDFCKWHKIDIFDCSGDKRYCHAIESFIAQFTIISRKNIDIYQTYCGYYCLAYAYYKVRHYSHYQCLYMLNKILDIRKLCFKLYCCSVFL